MNEWMTEKDLATEGIQSRSKSRQDRVRGVGFPFYYIGRSVRYKRSEVMACLEANRATSTLQRRDNTSQQGRLA